MKTPTCHFCRSNNVQLLLDLGCQPVSNRFLTTNKEGEFTYHMVLNQCHDCGLLQINDSVPAEELRPLYDWITYNEPEGHLDHLVGIIKTLPGITPQSSFCGISFKDDSTLTRFNKLGFSKTRRLDPQDDLHIENKGIGVETLQARLTPAAASRIVQKFGRFDVVVVRHILEHAHQVSEFVEALKILTAKEGCLVFEVPDCSRALETYDYTTIWEEHTLYFTPVTFENCLKLAGFSLKQVECYPYPFENSLVAIVQTNGQAKQSEVSKDLLNHELVRARDFARHLPKRALALQNFLKAYRQNQGKIALFGAGHLACTFVNILGLKNFIDFFVDDNPHKRGLFMPGCRLPIYESSILRKEKVRLCLLSLNPLSEEKVVQAQKDWKGTFFSIFPSSPRALRLPAKEIHKEVLHTSEAVVKVSKTDIAALKDKALNNDRRRIRLCCHRDVNDTLHEMMIIHSKNAYIRPHKHLNKSESLHVVEGAADFIFFDEEGNILEVIPMGRHLSGRRFYYRMSESFYHTLSIRSDFFVFHETTKGPFQNSDTVYASWAPEESNISACRDYRQKLDERIYRILETEGVPNE